MRIIAGEHGGRKLLSPRTLRVRPTSDRVKESIFNILGSKCIDTKVLDLYAGVGALGLEAISRGASEATFVDMSIQSVQYIKRNAEFCRDQVKILPTNTLTAINTLHKKNETFDLVFIDPPYEQNLINPTLQKLDECFILNSGFVIVVQHSKREEIKGEFKKFSVTDSRKYGDTLVSFLSSSS